MRKKSNNNQLTDIEARLIHSTDKAFLIDDGKRREWVPKSAVEMSEDEKTFTMPTGMAYEKGFI